jgi:glycosyltransferase involved in cell wall biosynthesis
VTEPLVSVVIPTFRRTRELVRTLAGWDRQTLGDAVFEVIVVDDGSGDETLEVVSAHRSQRYDLRVRSQANTGPAGARNTALAMARGRWVLITGDDIEPAPDLLAAHLRAHLEEDDETVAVLGLTRWARDQELTATMRHVDGVGAQQFSYHWMEDGAFYDFRHFYTSNISVARSMLDREPDGFSLAFPHAAFEDAEFAYRLSHHGLRIRYRAAAVGWHRHPYDVAGFFRRQRRCGEMAALLAEIHPQLGRWASLRELRWLAAAVRRLGAMEARRLGEATDRLDDHEARLVRLASVYDRAPRTPEGHDDLLLVVFRYGYQRGVLDRIFAPDVARRTAAALLLRDVVPAVRAYRERLSDEGWPLPGQDAAVIIAA